KIILITSMNRSDILVEESSHRGKVALRDYIQFAKTKKIEIHEDTNLPPDSDFEKFVIRMLERKGFQAVPQVGVQGFRVDIGVKHPDFPNGYIAGIECDGATYHSSPQARDRDRIRQEILESLGWRIYRIWSTDWFSDSDKEAEKCISWLKKIAESESKKNQSRQNLPTSGQLSTEKTPKKPNIETRNEPKGINEIKPSGQKKSLLVGDAEITYYQQDDGIFEIYDGEQLAGWVEIEKRATIGGADYSQAIESVTAPEFLATLIHSDEIKHHKTLQSGMRWVFNEYQLANTT
ncbi:MAG: hypothetical protein HOI69_10435, partial [Gammaproteobacteria bacterium]|nr:hypothetical protein [Gammaproteobacteria bacterium]